MMNKEVLTEYYSEIANKLDEMIPCEWEKVVLNAENTGNSSTARFYFYTSDSKVHSSGSIEDEFGVDEDEHLDRLQELWDINERLRQEFIDAGEPAWYSYTFYLDSEWKFKIKYEYEINENISSMERGVRWAYDELGIIPTGKYSKKLLREYFEELGKELIPELMDGQEATTKKNQDEKVDSQELAEEEEEIIECTLTQEEIDYRKKICTTIVEDEELCKYISALCCMDFLKEWEPLSNVAEEFVFNMDGQVFAEDGGGGHYVFLEDGSVGYVNFAENECGRAAENLKEMMELEMNCAYSWHNYATEKFCGDIDHLRKFVYGLEQDGRFDYEDAFGDEVPEYDEVQKIVADRLGLNIYENIVDDVIIPFYKVTTRKPEFKTKSTGRWGLNGLIH